MEKGHRVPRTFSIHSVRDADIQEVLDAQPNASAFIRDAIREKMDGGADSLLEALLRELQVVNAKLASITVAQATEPVSDEAMDRLSGLGRW